MTEWVRNAVLQVHHNPGRGRAETDRTKLRRAPLPLPSLCDWFTGC